MIKTIPGTRLVAVRLPASCPASAVFARPAGALRAAAHVPPAPRTAQDHEVLIVAPHLAAESMAEARQATDRSLFDVTKGVDHVN